MKCVQSYLHNTNTKLFPYSDAFIDNFEQT